MIDENEIGVTVVSHDSENRTLVEGYESKGSYSREIHYRGANISQLVSLINVSKHCEQFIKYECFGSTLNDGFWVSRDSVEMNYWGGAAPDSGKCACGMYNNCANEKKFVTVIRMTENGGRTVATSLKRHIYQLNS